MPNYEPEYEIRIRYWTGDSFSTEDRETSLDGTWKNVDVIKENVRRIREHYEWYQSLNNYHRSTGKLTKPSWFTAKSEHSINLKLDVGTEYYASPFWCGYFEGLYGIDVVKAKDKTEELGFEY